MLSFPQYCSHIGENYATLATTDNRLIIHILEKPNRINLRALQVHPTALNVTWTPIVAETNDQFFVHLEVCIQPAFNGTKNCTRMGTPVDFIVFHDLGSLKKYNVTARITTLKEEGRWEFVQAMSGGVGK